MLMSAINDVTIIFRTSDLVQMALIIIYKSFIGSKHSIIKEVFFYRNLSLKSVGFAVEHLDRFVYIYI